MDDSWMMEGDAKGIVIINKGKKLVFDNFEDENPIYMKLPEEF